MERYYTTFNKLIVLSTGGGHSTVTYLLNISVDESGNPPLMKYKLSIT